VPESIRTLPSPFAQPTLICVSFLVTFRIASPFLASEPKLELKVGDIVLHKVDDKKQSLAEISFIGKITSEIVLSFQGGYMDCDKNQILTCECKSLGCNGAHLPGYMVSHCLRGQSWIQTYLTK
jgi:hypothetical protein